MKWIGGWKFYYPSLDFAKKGDIGFSTFSSPILNPGTKTYIFSCEYKQHSE